MPKTASSVGAKEMNVSNFMHTIVTDYYSKAEQRCFEEGIGKIDELSKSRQGSKFLNLSQEERHSVLLDLEKEIAQNSKVVIEIEEGEGTSSEEVTHYYIMIKQLTIWAFLSSAQVAKESFKWMPVPGAGGFNGCVPVTDETKAIFGGTSSGQSMGYATYYARNS